MKTFAGIVVIGFTFGLLFHTSVEAQNPFAPDPSLNPGSSIPETPSTPPNTSPSLRRFQIVPRSSLPFHVDWRETSAGQSVAVLSGGINILIEGVRAPQLAGFGFSPEIGTIDIMTDRAVVWTSGVQQDSQGGHVQTNDMPLEIYMEGNIVVRQGDREIYATRMFYDVRNQVGVLLDAELLTTLPEYKGKKYEGIVRLRAAAIQQLSHSQFLAQNALITTSRLEEPSYYLGSQSLWFQDNQIPTVDPVTGQTTIRHEQRVTAKNNRIMFEGFPVFYWPTLSTDLQRPNFYVNNFRFRNDRVFGTQLLVGFDAYQLLGVENRPPNTTWDVSLDLLSKRGVGWGSTYEYENRPFFSLPGSATGSLDLWGIKDDGLDNLGRGRQGLIPEKKFRGHAIWQHRHQFDTGWQLTGEIGWLSDRSFQEQYYEQDWDEQKDTTTALELKQTRDNQSVSIRGEARINNFFTQTQWLPKFDHYWLGQSLLSDHLTWYEHTSLAYANIGLGGAPSDPVLAAQWKRLPWEFNVRGERLITRHEIDAPFELGYVKFVPFALGELGHWGADVNGNAIDRAYFQAGVRASVPFWAIYPNVRDPLFNLNGLAHKVVFDAEYSFADSNRNHDQFPLYDSLDDDAIEEFRRRLFFTTFGGVLPGQVPQKYNAVRYALRSGIQNHVTSPTMEIVDDLEVVRVGMKHRWQTKRGAPGREHIVDWLTFDMNASWFPKPARDNFGEVFGLLDYDLRWHLGDRFTVVSDGAADLFGGGLQTVSGGIIINRPDRGNGYVGFRSVRGPFTANVLTGSYAYRMTPKWVMNGSASVDLSNTGNIGQTFSMTRVGESLLVTVGVHADSAKHNVGLNFMIEPRFLPTSQLLRKTGLAIPPIGRYEVQ